MASCIMSGSWIKKINGVLFLLLITSCITAQIKLPKLISDGMVLQRNDSTKIWGWATPGEVVRAELDQRQYVTAANAAGKWFITLAPKSAGGPYTLQLNASNKLLIKDILFGDVYVCSGQSNMELPMRRLPDQYPIEITQAVYPAIRQFMVEDAFDFEQKREDFPTGTWVAASPETVLDFSAVAYFFAVNIWEKYQVPIGIINAAVGGSPAQAWISENGLRQFPAYLKEMQTFKNKFYINEIETSDRGKAKAWQDLLNSTDEGLKQNWKNSQVTEDWQELKIPGSFATMPLGHMNGIIWFKKEITLSGDMATKPAKLLLGRIVDADSIFINGKFAGTTSYQYPPRRYLLPAGLLKEGKNIITIRLVVNAGGAAFIPDKKYQLIAGQDTLNLAGIWKYRVGTKIQAAPGQTFVRWKAGGLFNAMIAPLQNYRIKGALWYQGEANTGNPSAYEELMTTLVTDWRKGWGQESFPFLYVQLPGFMEAKDQPSESNWAALRAAQFKLLKVPYTAMAVAIDLGEWNDIHPLNKREVGNRLALQARHLVYGDTAVVYSGPLVKEATLSGKKVTISFFHRGTGLIAKNNDTLQQFTIAGTDGVFRKARAKIIGEKVIAWCDQIDHPARLRYAWADNPDGANLYNKEGLPAAPFEVQLK